MRRLNSFLYQLDIARQSFTSIASPCVHVEPITQGYQQVVARHVNHAVRGYRGCPNIREAAVEVPLCFGSGRFVAVETAAVDLVVVVGMVEWVG